MVLSVAPAPSVGEVRSPVGAVVCSLPLGGTVASGLVLSVPVPLAPGLAVSPPAGAGEAVPYDRAGAVARGLAPRVARELGDARPPGEAAVAGDLIAPGEAVAGAEAAAPGLAVAPVLAAPLVAAAPVVAPVVVVEVAVPIPAPGLTP